MELRDQLQATLGDSYRIDRELGGGGMSRVFVATEKTLGREIVVKVVPSDAASSVSVERFKREIQVAAKLQHPHIVPVLSAGEAGKVPYYTMPFVKGESLRVRLTKSGELSVNETMHILRDVASALVHAHAEGIVHRDIKPENVILSGGVAVVTDFGVAKAMDLAVTDGGGTATGLTSLGVALGTPAYMAPEQASADPHVDHRADIYSFGCVAYEMLAGSSPFAGRPLQQLLAAHVTENPDSLLKRRPTVPPALAALVMKCLEKRAGDRPQSAEELLLALDAIGTPSGGTAPTGARMAAVRKPRTIAYAVAVIAVAAVIAVVVWAQLGAFSPFVVGTTQSVVASNNIEFDPAISPDGKLVAFVGETDEGDRVFVKQLDGGRANMLAGDIKEDQAFPHWSPDGSRISFVVGTTLGVVPALGGSPQPLIRLRDDEVDLASLSHSWSPDGLRIAYSTRQGIRVRDIAGGQPRAVVDGAFLHSPAWSPDGRLIAYVEGRIPSIGNISTNSIWAVAATGGTPVRVSDSTRINLSPVWAPDGRSVLFVSDVGGTRDVYQQPVAADGRRRGTPVRLTTALLPFAISLSKDGTRLVHDVVRNFTNLWLAPFTANGAASLTGIRQITRENQHVETSSTSRDGAWLVYDSDIGGNFDLWKIRFDGGEPARLTTSPGNDFGPSWSGDGEEIAFHSHRLGTRDIFVMSGDGRDERQVTSGPAQDYFADWVGPNALVYYSDSVGRRTTLYVVTRGANGAWSAPRRITPDTVTATNPRVSPNGELIAFTVSFGSQTGFAAVVAPDGSKLRIIADRARLGGASAAGVEWKDNSTVYVNTRRQIWSVSLSGAAPRLVYTPDDEHYPARAEFNITAKGILYSVADYESDIRVMDLRAK